MSTELLDRMRSAAQELTEFYAREADESSKTIRNLQRKADYHQSKADSYREQADGYAEDVDYFLSQADYYRGSVSGLSAGIDDLAPYKTKRSPDGG